MNANSALDHITVTPSSSSILAGDSQTYTTRAFDALGNSWVVTASYTIGGTLVSNPVSLITAGDYTVTASYGGKTATASLNVMPASAIGITLKMTPSSIVAGSQSEATVTAFDDYGNSWLASSYAAFSINGNAGGSWSGNVYTSANAGTWTITATLEGLSATATLTVTANYNQPGRIVISPKSPSIQVGSTQQFNTVAYDQFGNSLGDVTAATTFSAPGANVTGNIVGSNTVGIYTVTATYKGLTDSTTLTVSGYTVTFKENGLPNQTAWSVTIGGTTYNSTADTITVPNLSAQNYLWNSTEQILQGLTRFVTASSTGTLNVPTQLTQTINFTTQHQVTYMAKGNDLTVAVPAQQWVNSGQQATGIFPTLIIDAAQTTRCSYLSDNRTTIVQPTTVAANYQTQYYLTINSQYGTPNGAGWYNTGATAIAQISSTTATGGSGTQYVFTVWSGDATGSAATSNQMTMNSPKTATANWKTQYYLTVTSAYGNPSGQGWYDAGTTASITVNQNITSTNTQHNFKEWSGNGYTGTANTATFQMNAPTSQTASWQTQYQVTYKATGNTLIVTVPQTEWVKEGSKPTGTFAATITNTISDTRCLFVSDNRPASINKPTEITATYQTQYLLNFTQKGLESDATGTIVNLTSTDVSYTQLPYTLWVNKDSQIAFNYTNNVESTAFAKQYVLTETNATSPTTISAPTVIQATFESQFSLFTIAGATLLLLLLLLLVALLVWAERRRRKKKKQSTNQASSSTETSAS